MTADVCEWIECEDDEEQAIYKTACGCNDYANAPQDLGFKYCPYCGKSIVERRDKNDEY